MMNYTSIRISMYHPSKHRCIVCIPNYTLIETTGGNILVNLLIKLTISLGTEITNVFFWTIGTIVLSLIRGQSSRWPDYVMLFSIHFETQMEIFNHDKIFKWIKDSCKKR